MAVVEGVQEIQEQYHDGPSQLESRAKGIATQSNAPTDELKGEIDRASADPKAPKREIIEVDDVVEIPAFPPSTRTTSNRVRGRVGSNVVFHFYTPAGKWTRTRSLGQCCDVKELFGDALTAKAFGPFDEKKREKANVLSIYFGVSEPGQEDDLRVKEGDKEDFKGLVYAIKQRKWWIERNELVFGSGIIEVKAVL